jgi:ketosteroid isomerase-like protein
LGVVELTRRGTRSALTAALERGDAGAAGACYADDARMLTPGSLFQGRKAIEEYWRTGIALGLSSVRFEAQRVELRDTRQFEIGRYRIAIESDQAHGAFERGIYVGLHHHAIDGTWHFVVDVLDPDEPPGSSAHPQGDKKWGAR